MVLQMFEMWHSKGKSAIKWHTWFPTEDDECSYCNPSRADQKHDGKRLADISLMLIGSNNHDVLFSSNIYIYILSDIM